MTGAAKLLYTALLFGAALGLLVAAAATHSAVPLFFMWAPLLGVPWVLARPERVDPEPAAAQDLDQDRAERASED